MHDITRGDVLEPARARVLAPASAFAVAPTGVPTAVLTSAFRDW